MGRRQHFNAQTVRDCIGTALLGLGKYGIPEGK